jgi:uncharacterized repeat protein (TIGR01451 family)
VFDQAGTVPLPIQNPTDADPPLNLFDPDNHCLANLDVQVTQDVVRGGGASGPDSVLTDAVLARGGETLTFRVTVRNNSALEVTDLLICNSIMPSGADCVPLQSLGPSESFTQNFSYTVPQNADGVYAEAIPSVEGPRISRIEGAALRVVVSCDDVAVIPAPGNPIPKANEEDAQVMRGGH